MTLADTWQISRSRSACCACGTEFGEGQSFFSGLKDQGPDLVRLDFCTRCWSESAPDGFFCFWRRRRPRSDRKPVANTDLILGFFDRLDGLEPDKRRLFRFVLALYLMRRREFKLVRVARDEGTETLVFERRRPRGEVRVESPGLTEQQIQDTEDQLSRLLDMCL